MTGSHENILAEYRDADLNRRLHMYLQLPDLRSDFFVIDQDVPNVDSSKTVCSKTKCREGIGRTVVGLFSGFLKKAVDWILPEGFNVKKARS
ncbi:MAG: hypothetical protein HY788_21180 [Deltaproteobacteria bacterium]|nr:hypothetical protein [Deltaproteobacteria bacterium]